MVKGGIKKKMKQKDNLQIQSSATKNLGKWCSRKLSFGHIGKLLGPESLIKQTTTNIVPKAR